MLEVLRNASTGWLAKGLIGLLVLSFAVWGISGSLFFGVGNSVIKVGETTVTPTDLRFAYDNGLARLSQNFGRRLSRQEADALGLRQSVIGQLLSGAVLEEYSRKMQLGISDDNLAKSIASIPAFQDLQGDFSRSTFRSVLRQNGMNEDDFISDYRKSAIRDQFEESSSGKIQIPAVFTKAFEDFQNETRVFDYVLIGAEAIENRPVPTSEQIETYFENNKQSYRAPEYRKINLLSVTADDLAEPEKVTDADIQAEYDNQKANLKTEEKRTIEQLVFSNAEEAAKASEQLKSGSAFEEVVTGTGKTLADISLGTLEKAKLPDAKIAEGAFAAELNTPTNVIEGVFGPVILRVTKIDEQKTTPLIDVKDDLRNEIAKRFAAERVYEFFEAIEEERGAGETLDAIAGKFDLAARVLESVDASGKDIKGASIEDIPNAGALLPAAFASEPGDDNQAIEIGSDGFVWFEVLDVTAERQKELSEVESDVKSAWIVGEVDKMVGELADKIKARIAGGEDFNTVLGELLPKDSLGLGVTHETSIAVTRDDDTASKLPARVRTVGFGVKEGELTTTALPDGGHAVLRVAEIGKGDGSKLTAAQSTQMNSTLSNDLLSQVVGALQERDPASINYQLIDAAFVN